MKTLFLAGFLWSLFIGANLNAQDYLAMVRPQNSKTWGYVNEQGKMIIEPQYRDCYPFSADGYAIIVQKRQHQFINTKGEILATGLKKFSLKEFFGGFGMFGSASLLSFDEGLVPIREKKAWGFLNTEGKMAIPMKYENVSGFRDGHAFAILKGKFYILDKTGKESAVVTKDITEIKRPSEGMVAYRNKSKLMGFVDANGAVVIKAQYAAVGHFVAGLAWARNDKDLIGFIDKEGNWAIKPQFEAAKNFDPVSGIAKVKKNGTWGYITKEGQELKLNIQTDVYGNFVEGLAKGRKDKKIGFFGTDGNWVIKPKFESVGKVSNGYIAAKENGLWGFIDLKGNWVIKPQFEGVRKMVKLN